MEQEMGARGIRVEWANSIQSAGDLLNSALDGTSFRHGTCPCGWQLERPGGAHQVCSKSRSDRTHGLCQHGGAVVGRAGVWGRGYFSDARIAFSIIPSPENTFIIPKWRIEEKRFL